MKKLVLFCTLLLLLLPKPIFAAQPCQEGGEERAVYNQSIGQFPDNVAVKPNAPCQSSSGILSGVVGFLNNIFKTFHITVTDPLAAFKDSVSLGDTTSPVATQPSEAPAGQVQGSLDTDYGSDTPFYQKLIKDNDICPSEKTYEQSTYPGAVKPINCKR